MTQEPPHDATTPEPPHDATTPEPPHDATTSDSTHIATTDSTRAAADAPPLELAGVTKRYEGGSETIEALVDVDLAVRAGEFLAVIGPSGSGRHDALR